MEKTVAHREFSRDDVARITQLEPHTVHYYVVEGVLRASKADAHGSGTRRKFSFVDVVVALVVAALREFGMSQERMKGAAKAVRSFTAKEMLGAAAHASNSFIGIMMLADGTVERLTEDRNALAWLDVNHITTGAYFINVSRVAYDLMQRLTSDEQSADAAPPSPPGPRRAKRIANPSHRGVK